MLEKSATCRTWHGRSHCTAVAGTRETVQCRSQMLQGSRPYRAACWRSCPHCQSHQERALVSGSKTLSQALSVHRHLLMQLNAVPVGKGKLSEGPSSVFTEQAERVRLELRGTHLHRLASKALSRKKRYSFIEYDFLYLRNHSLQKQTAESLLTKPRPSGQQRV